MRTDIKVALAKAASEGRTLTVEQRIEEMRAANLFPVKLDGEPACDVWMERGMVVVETRIDRARFTGRVADLVLTEKAGAFQTRETRRYACC